METDDLLKELSEKDAQIGRLNKLYYEAAREASLKRASALEILIARLRAQASVRKVQGAAFNWNVELLSAIDASLQTLELIEVGRHRSVSKPRPLRVDDVEKERWLLQSLREFVASLTPVSEPPVAVESGSVTDTLAHALSSETSRAKSMNDPSC
jgi:hypothetical protein